MSKKKKFVSTVLVALMVVTMTAGCGQSEPKESGSKVSPDSNPGTENRTEADADDAGNRSVAPDSGTLAEETPVDAPRQVFELNCDELDEWIYYGFKSTNTIGEEVILGMNAKSDYGVLIIADADDLTAVSFIESVEYVSDD